MRLLQLLQINFHLPSGSVDQWRVLGIAVTDVCLDEN